MTYAETIEFLYSLRLFGTKLGLETSFALAELCGNPQKDLRFIHVAGTNGKGSVCAMLESIYRQAGLRVGLFTSPHLISLTERIQVNRRLIPETEVSRLTELLIQHLGGDQEEWPFRPTFFEFVTLMALLHFREQNCDLVIWETGMGGRLDATNIVTPLASVITTVQFDHQQWLGNTLREIAIEKAGIIKPGVPVIVGELSPEAMSVIEETAQRKGSPLTVARGDDPWLKGVRLGLAGPHQRLNAAVTLATVKALQPEIPVTEDEILTGMSNTFWPGRLQVLESGKSTIVLDGAHNPDGARSLAAALDELLGNRELTLVLGLFKDKAWREMCDALVPKASRVFLVPIQSERSADPFDVITYCVAQWPRIPFIACDSSATALEQARAFPFIVVAGSLYLVGEVMQQLGIGPRAISERQLNEWDAANEKTAKTTA
jgi:dihydrofolate synthase / folylpolyglutamate synthase